MSNLSQKNLVQEQTLGRQRQLRRGNGLKPGHANPDIVTTQVDVGLHLRALRAERNLSIRLLADQSGLNVNTLSLIENGKTSPSVSTLQQLASALNVPITAFFEKDDPVLHVAYQKASHRRRAAFAHGTLEDLGSGLLLGGGQPFLVTLQPDSDSGPDPIVHTGIEFVFCLKGSLCYTIENQTYTLEADDSLVFEAHLPHRWKNTGSTESRFLLILCPTDEKDHPTEQHFRLG